MRISDIGEFKLIELLTADLNAGDERLVLGPGDDAAAISPTPGRYLLATTDMLVEGTHFLLDSATPGEIGHRSLAANLSDIAAMGGLPTFCLVSLAAPGSTPTAFMTDLYGGIRNLARDFGVRVIGGDLTDSRDGLVISIAQLGEVEPELMTRRSGALPGNAIVVTGSPGRARAGLELILNPDLRNSFSRNHPDEAKILLASHLRPRPRIDEARVLVENHPVTAMNDISDGLASEVHEICEASGCGAEIEAGSLPPDPALALLAEETGDSPLDWTLYGGEDFELVFTISRGSVDELLNRWPGRVPLGVIGRITEERGKVTLIDNGGGSRPLPRSGYSHFGKD